MRRSYILTIIIRAVQSLRPSSLPSRQRILWRCRSMIGKQRYQGILSHNLLLGMITNLLPTEFELHLRLCQELIIADVVFLFESPKG